MTGRLLQMSGVVIDLVHHVDHVPRAGEEVETPGLMVTAGGGFNAMVAAKRLGAAVAYGGAIGTGIFADIVSRMLAAEGFEVLTSSRPPVDQGTCVVLVDRDGERSFVSNHGAERCLDAAELSRIAIKDYDWILLTGYGLFKSESAEVLGPGWSHFRAALAFFLIPVPLSISFPGAI